jgi:hypothetical protein
MDSTRSLETNKKKVRSDGGTVSTKNVSKYWYSEPAHDMDDVLYLFGKWLLSSTLSDSDVEATITTDMHSMIVMPVSPSRRFPGRT